MPVWPLLQAGNPLTFDKLIITISFQVGLLGCGLLIAALVAVPYFTRMEARAMGQPTKPKRFIRLLPPFVFKGVCFILLVGTLGILLTDVGWLKAWQTYAHVVHYPNANLTEGWQNVLLFARASGAPNGAHLLSYIPLPLLGLYVAIKYRKDVMLDCFQGILVVAFGVAIHESIWLVAYWSTYAQYWNLGVATNVAEDFFFMLMCLLFIIAYWKYPYRTIPLKTFQWPIAAYSAFMVWWYAEGVPVTTINNWQLGKGIYMTTPLWGDPFVNGVEILSWVLVAFLFWVAIWRQRTTA